MAYIFDAHYGQCSLADGETGIVIEWKSGKFDETQKSHCEGAILPGKDPELYIARKLREMGDYIAENYPDLV